MNNKNNKLIAKEINKKIILFKPHQLRDNIQYLFYFAGLFK